eukprot:gnl/MRDRNA2_/MRDRNA2_98103_c0_seq1.p1 gnl/MRDRNA2_/MRDRNA2_98103_c0~~gnl/MRDRNA2_/MRDRNA2_98103_c0_seq1.p1  ORF type:complete len:370 (+),score=85.30 gnl/MRDRNA2_/MRDRNA2_98103_c0_seq1:49-1110(+)
MSAIRGSGPQSPLSNVGKISLADLGCSAQTAAPLPLKYPANLIFAQNMLAMSVCQTQQLEMHIAMLSLHLRERMLGVQTVQAAPQTGSLAPPAASPPPSAAKANWLESKLEEFYAARQEEAAARELPAVPQQAAVPVEHIPVIQPDFVAQAPVDAAGPPGAEPGAPLGDAANGDQPAAGDQAGAVWQQYRLAAIMKIALIMILLEVKTGWFFVYFFAVFLYIGGVFDPFVEWFQRHTQRLTLDQQLTRLRNKNRMRAEKRAAAAMAAALARANAEGAEGTDDGGVGDEGNPASSNDATQDGSTDGEEVENADQGDQGVPEPAIPWGHRFFYQLVVMFFMTLLPWWSPDPRYIE